MKQPFLLLNTRAFVPIAVFCVLVLGGCKVTFVPGYDARISDQIVNIAKDVDKFYLSMLETTTAADSGRVYKNFAEQYVSIEVELNSLLVKNKIRPLNENSTRICEIAIEMWIKYKEEHKKDDSLSDGLIRLNRKTFSDLFFAMQVAEKGKQIANNPDAP
jgi:hypothetical protein